MADAGARGDAMTRVRPTVAERTLPVELVLALTYFGLAIALTFSGMSLAQALTAAVVMAVPSIALCVAVWRLLHPSTQAQRLLVIATAVSLSIGVVALGSWVAGVLDLAVPTIACAVAFVVIAVVFRPHDEFHLSLQTSSLLVALPGVTILTVAPIWGSMPASVADSVIYPDWTFHQVIGSATQIGYDKNPLFAGHPYGYHWLGDAFGVAIERAAGLEILQGISRALYAQAALGATAAAMSIGWSTTGKMIGAVSGAFSLAFGCWAFLPVEAMPLPLSTEPSPTYATSIPIALTVVALATDRRWPLRPQLALLLALSVLLTVARVTTSGVVFGALVLAVLVANPGPRRGWLAVVTVAAGFLIGLALVGSTPTQSLAVAPNLETVRLYGLFPYTGPGAEAFGLASLLGIGTAVFLLGMTRARLDEDHAMILALGGAAPFVAIVGSCLTLQAGSSQITFLWAGLALAAVVLGPTVVSLVESRLAWQVLIAILLAGLVFAGLLMATLWVVTHVGFGGLARWGLAIGTSTIICGTSVAFLRLSRRHGKSRPPRMAQGWAASLAVALVAGTWFGIAATGWRLMDPHILAEPSVAIDAREADAASWLRENSGARDVVATNRQCLTPSQAGRDCFSAIFTVGALTGRVMDIEGVPYAVGANPQPEALQRVNDGLLAAKGDVDAIRRLADRGVSWLWIDKRATPDSNAVASYDNGLVAIVRVAHRHES